MLSTYFILGSIATSIAIADPITVPFSRRAPTPRLHKRQAIFNGDPVELPHDDNNGEWEVEIGVGTPPQMIKVQLDTGSSDLWVFTPQGCAEANGEGYGCNGTFVSDSSSTYTDQVKNAPPFSILYGDGSGVNGTYFKDTLQVGSFSIPSQVMGLAEEGDSGNGQISTGVFGVGFDFGEAGSVHYANAIDNFIHNNSTAVRAFSMYLNDRKATGGNIIFGGYDSSQWIGDLAVVPMLPDPRNGNPNYYVGLSSVGVTSKAGSQVFEDDSLPAPALLDSGTSSAHVPASIYAKISKYFNAAQNQYNQAVVDCSALDSDITLDWGFGGPGGPVVSVPMSQFVAKFDGDEDEAGYCYLIMSPAGDTNILGDSFLTSAYTVYDQDSKLIGIAPAVLGTTGVPPNVKSFDERGVLGIEGSYLVANELNLAPAATTSAELATTSNPVPSAPALDNGIGAMATPTRYMNVTVPTYAPGSPTSNGDAADATHTDAASSSRVEYLGGAIGFFLMSLFVL